MKSIKAIFYKLKNNIFWRSVVILVSGTALAQLIGVFTTPVVSRLYDPKAFGEYALILSTSTIILNIVILGLSSAVMVPTSDEESSDVFMVAFLTMLILSTVILIIMFLLSPLIHFFKLGINYAVACTLVYAFVIVHSTSGLLKIYINRKRLNRVLFYNSLIGAFATLFITIPLGFLKLGGLGLMAASLVAGIVSISQMIYHANPFNKIPTLRVFKSVFRKYRDFIIYQYPANFIGHFATQVPTQVFSAVFGNANLGSYSMNEKVLGIPSRLIGAPINTVYFRTASEYHREGKSLAEFTFSLVTKIMLIAFLPISITIFWGEQIFIWVLGPHWGEAGQLAGFLIVQYVYMFCTNCTSYCRVAIGKQNVNFVVNIFRLTFIVLSIYLGVHFTGDLFNTMIFFSIGSSLYLILDMAMNFYSLGRYWMKYTVFALIYFFIVIILWFLAGNIKI